VRFNQASEPYSNRDVRNALQMAVDNNVVLELGYNNRGVVAENHHVCPIHPEYAPGINEPVDPAAAMAMLEAAGEAGTEFELISLDDQWQAATCDAVAAQCRDAGINVKRTVLPGSTFWNDWTKYPWSATEWNMRPLGVQIYNVAYKSGVAWNETAFINPEFDAGLAEANSISDADARRAVMDGSSGSCWTRACSSSPTGARSTATRSRRCTAWTCTRPSSTTTTSGGWSRRLTGRDPFRKPRAARQCRPQRCAHQTSGR
jgi:ABC-type transport system substrate-binding protein